MHDLKKWIASKKLSQAKEMGDGVLFSTYTLLARGSKTAVGDTEDAVDPRQTSRVWQIVEWCGSHFDGVIAFDEAHKAKNITMKPPSRANALSKAARKNLKMEAELDIYAEGQGKAASGASRALQHL